MSNYVYSGREENVISFSILYTQHDLLKRIDWSETT